MSQMGSQAFSAFVRPSMRSDSPGIISILAMMSLKMPSRHFNSCHSCSRTSGGATLLGSKLYALDFSCMESASPILSSEPPMGSFFKIDCRFPRLLLSLCACMSSLVA